MSKAEDLAEKLYPKKEHVAFGPLPCEEPSVFDDNKPYRIGFIEGYHQAEKDNELTWEDVEIIINAFLDFCIENKERGKEKRYNDKEYCVEVLKRFKERKGK